MWKNPSQKNIKPHKKPVFNPGLMLQTFTQLLLEAVIMKPS